MDNRSGGHLAQSNADVLVLKFEIGKPVLVDKIGKFAELVHIRTRRSPDLAVFELVWSLSPVVLSLSIAVAEAVISLIVDLLLLSLSLRRHFPRIVDQFDHRHFGVVADRRPSLMMRVYPPLRSL